MISLSRVYFLKHFLSLLLLLLMLSCDFDSPKFIFHNNTENVKVDSVCVFVSYPDVLGLHFGEIGSKEEKKGRIDFSNYTGNESTYYCQVFISEPEEKVLFETFGYIDGGSFNYKIKVILEEDLSISSKLY